MTRLIDVHAPHHDIAETLVVHVDASPAAVLAAADRLGCDPFAGVEILDERVFAVAWHPRPGVPGRVDVVWDLRAEPDAEDGCYLTSTRRFVASDEGSREALFASWRLVGANADAIARQTCRAIKRAAEDAPALPHVVEVPLAA